MNKYEYLVDRVLTVINDDCWIWEGGTRGRGYGAVRVGDKVKDAHVAAYEVRYGSCPDGLQHSHTCNNPPCWNPKHIILETGQENLSRRTFPERTHCSHGHPYNEANTYLRPGNIKSCKICRRVSGKKNYVRKLSRI